MSEDFADESGEEKERNDNVNNDAKKRKENLDGQTIIVKGEDEDGEEENAVERVQDQKT